MHRRGRNQFPQFLHPGRYDEIRKTWLSHGIPTFVARKLDAVTDHVRLSSQSGPSPVADLVLLLRRVDGARFKAMLSVEQLDSSVVIP